MEKLCDLHAHSYYSDGSLSPAQLVEAARAAGLSAVVLSDHNTVAGLPEFVSAAAGSGVEAVPGVEFSTEYQGSELHILGLFVLPENYGPIQAMLEQFLIRKEKSNRELVARLEQAGMVLSYDAIAEKAAGRVNRAVIAEEMVRLGYCESVKQAFSQWLSVKQGYYVPPVRPDAFETIRFIKSLGCAAVLAHPFLNLEEKALRLFLKDAKAAGLDGMEVYYARYDGETTALAQSMAKEFGILESGGSDFHGTAKPDIALGSGTGSLRIPMELLEKLRPCAPNAHAPVCGGRERILKKYEN